jgi:RNA polymerase sigma-70 factor (ECF subfamily)
MGPPGDGVLDREAVNALYAQYAPVIFRRARALLGRDADAWDAVQEVFMRMLTSGSTFRGEARPMTWVYRITTNTCLNLLRTRRLREPLLTVVPDEPATGTDPVEARQHLQRWLAHLDERELSIASLLYLDGLTQQEVADTLGLSRKTIVREVDALRQKLAALEALP